jgi:hypothetical protein
MVAHCIGTVITMVGQVMRSMHRYHNQAYRLCIETVKQERTTFSSFFFSKEAFD